MLNVQGYDWARPWHWGEKERRDGWEAFSLQERGEVYQSSSNQSSNQASNQSIVLISLEYGYLIINQSRSYHNNDIGGNLLFLAKFRDHISFWPSGLLLKRSNQSEKVAFVWLGCTHWGFTSITRLILDQLWIKTGLTLKSCACSKTL